VILASLFLAAALQAAPAQDPGSIQGAVREEGSGAPVPSAIVTLVELRRSARTGEDGAYVLRNVPAGTWTVRATSLGHQPAEVIAVVPPGGVLRLDLGLVARPVPLERVRVQGDAPATLPLADPAGPGAARLDAEALRATPAIFERDVMRAVQSLPSVAAASDFSAAPYIRGGSPDQTLVTLDGIPLYNPYHLGGLFSAVDPDAVQSVDVLAGAFPASVGDRAAGAMDIRTRDGGTDHVRSTGAIGLISARLGLDGPLPGGRGSWLFSTRRTYVDAVASAARGMGAIDFGVPYRFQDAHLKVTYPLAAGGRLTATGYVNREGFDFVPRDTAFDNQLIDFRWGSRAAGLQWWQPVGERGTLEVRGAWTGFGGVFELGEYPWDDDTQGYRPELVTQLDADTRIGDLQLSAAGTWNAGAHRLRAGVEAHRYRFYQDLATVDGDLRDYMPTFTIDQRPATVALWAEDAWDAGRGVQLRAGLRLLSAGESGTAVMPRLGASWALTPRLTLSAAAGRSAQLMHSLIDTERVPSSIMAYDALAAGRQLTVSDDVVLGAAWADGGTQVRVDGYLRRVEGLPLPPPHDDLWRNTFVHPDSFTVGSALARGLEVLATHRRGSTGMQLAYSLAFARRTLDTLSWTPRFDRRHSLDLSAWTGWGRGGQLSARLVVASGQPYTPVIGTTRRWFYDPQSGGVTGPGGEEPVMGAYNAGRLPAYLRLDVGARREIHRRWGGREVTLVPYLQVANLFNRPNVLFAIPERNFETGELATRITYGPQFPVLPTLGIEWRF
jgi:TonB dependent receptor/Carboxypeptidase regulatory-like domain/TonB-dependent Receptor Plug Domain